MQNHMSIRRWAHLAAAAIMLAQVIFSDGSLAQKKELTADEVVANHLQSVGSAAARAAVRTRVCEGAARLEILTGGFGSMKGPAAYVAQDTRQGLEMHFGNPEYSREVLTFTGAEVQAIHVQPGRRSRLGDFLHTYPRLMREGLFGGVYGTNWSLLDVQQRQPELHYRGVKKVDGKKVHQLDYEMLKDLTGLKVKLFFEEESFRHVRTEYTLTVRHGMRTDPSQSLSALEAYTRYKLQESFGEFKKVDGLDLPSRWEIRLTTEDDTGRELGGRSLVWEWQLKFDRIDHNQELNPQLFEVGN